MQIRELQNRELQGLPVFGFFLDLIHDSFQALDFLTSHVLGVKLQFDSQILIGKFSLEGRLD